MFKRLPLPELAFLSANGVETACGDERLPGEAAHFAAGMLNVGYRSVVGTMWAVDKANTESSELHARVMEDGKKRKRSFVYSCLYCKVGARV